jgi:hypothetical protein
MSEEPNSPYSELMRELEQRGEAIAAQNAPAAQKVHQLRALVDEGERRFGELLASRPENPPPDFDAIYKAKAELDRRLLGRPAPKRRWFTIAVALVCLVGVVVGFIVRGEELGVLVVQCWVDGPFWVPALFVAYALGRKTITTGFVLAFAVVEAAAIGWQYLIVTRF